MIGLIHVVLFDLIKEVADDEKVKEIKKKAGISLGKIFRIDQNYDDEEWQKLFKVSMEVLKLTEQQACNAYADYFHRDSLTRWSMWYEMSKNSKEFLERLPSIHNQFATGLASIEEKNFINDKQVVTIDGNILTNIYTSPNKLCVLYISLANVIADHYGDKINVSEKACMHNGDPNCEIQVEWTKIKNE